MPFFGRPDSDKRKLCERCGKELTHKQIARAQKFCGNVCYSESIRRIHVTKEELEHWYFDLGMTSIEIADRLGCGDRHVREIMAQLGVRLRDKSDAAINYPCRPFSGDSTEKAYMIGFRLGDLNVRKDLETSKRIQVTSSSTVPAQVDLICNLFATYGHVNFSSCCSSQIIARCVFCWRVAIPSPCRQTSADRESIINSSRIKVVRRFSPPHIVLTCP